MANYVVSDTNLTLIADAIRAKSGHNELLEWPNEYKTSIDNLNPVDMCIKTATDDIVSVSDAAQYDAKNVSIKIEPVQDLHGYDSPWPAGGGKNLYNSATFPSVTKSGITCTNNGDGSFTLNGTATSDVFFDVFTTQFSLEYDGTPLPSAEYRLTGCPSGGSSQTYYLYTIPNYHPDSGSGVTFTDEISGGSIYVKNGVTVNNLIFNPMIRLASNGDDTFAPYSNVCPISGWTGAKVTRTGINIWDEEWEVGGLNASTGGNWNTNTRIRSKNYFPVKPNTVYFNSFPSYGVGIDYCFYDINKTFISAGSAASVTITSPQNAYFMRLATYGQYGTTYNHDISINYPATDTSYHPYQGDTYDIIFPTEAGTVYGGMLDVTSGVLTVDRAMVTLTEDTGYSISTTDANRNRIAWGGYDSVGKQNGTFVSDTLATAPNGTGGVSTGDWQIFGSTAASRCWITVPKTIASVNDFKAYVQQHPIQICYELATPVTYQLTPQQVALLRGNNTLWADTGDVTLKYFTTAFEDLAEEIGFAERGDY